jgi:hypothetical protein
VRANLFFLPEYLFEMASADSASRCQSCTDWLVSVMISCSSYSCTKLVSIDRSRASTHFFFQRWIYRIDPERVNEYGQVLTDDALKADANGESKKEK